MKSIYRGLPFRNGRRDSIFSDLFSRDTLSLNIHQLHTKTQLHGGGTSSSKYIFYWSPAANGPVGSHHPQIYRGMQRRRNRGGRGPQVLGGMPPDTPPPPQCLTFIGINTFYQFHPQAKCPSVASGMWK